jgi:alkylhydroperoxidase family enzyme
MRDWRSAPLDRISARAKALCAHAEKLTERPSEVGPEDIGRLREAGCDDDAIHDLTQVIGLFNLYTRLAEGLGVDDEPDWDDRQG